MDIQKIVDSVIEELTGSAVKKGLKLIYNKPEKPLPLVNIDEEKMRQVIMNLIDNSIKYTEKGSIEVGCKDELKSIIIYVKDTGIGIKKNKLEDVFVKFSRMKESSRISVDGSGLGMFVAKTLTEAHGGKIWAESDGIGTGATFFIQLPKAS